MPLTLHARNAVINHMLGNAPYTPPTTVYLALCTADPGPNAHGASMNEVQGENGYQRRPITFSEPSNRRVTQAAEVLFPRATANYAQPVTHWAIVDTPSGAGNVIAYGALAQPRSFRLRSAPRMPQGSIFIEFTPGTGLTTYAAHGLLNMLFRGQAFPIGGTWLALSTNDMNVNPALAEPAGNGYARVRIHPNGGAAPSWSASTNGSASNVQSVLFPEATGPWGSLRSIAVVDSAATGSGNTLWFGALPETYDILVAGDQVMCDAGDVIVRFDP